MPDMTKIFLKLLRALQIVKGKDEYMDVLEKSHKLGWVFEELDGDHTIYKVIITDALSSSFMDVGSS
jgi:hypothetical protein